MCFSCTSNSTFRLGSSFSVIRIDWNAYRRNRCPITQTSRFSFKTNTAAGTVGKRFCAAGVISPSRRGNSSTLPGSRMSRFQRMRKPALHLNARHGVPPLRDALQDAAVRHQAAPGDDHVRPLHFDRHCRLQIELQLLQPIPSVRSRFFLLKLAEIVERRAGASFYVSCRLEPRNLHMNTNQFSSKHNASSDFAARRSP